MSTFNIKTFGNWLLKWIKKVLYYFKLVIFKILEICRFIISKILAPVVSFTFRACIFILVWMIKVAFSPKYKGPSIHSSIVNKWKDIWKDFFEWTIIWKNSKCSHCWEYSSKSYSVCPHCHQNKGGFFF